MFTSKIILAVKKKRCIYKLATKFYAHYSDALRSSVLLRRAGSLAGNREFQLEAGSVKKYCEENKIPRVILERAGTRPQYQAAFFEGTGAKVSKIAVPEIYYTVLNNAYVCAMNHCILVENRLLNDYFVLPLAACADFEQEPIIQYSEKRKCKVYGKVRKEAIREAIALTGLASNNYYHWQFDILSKMAYINEFEELKDVPLILDVTVSLHPTYMELLRAVDKYKHPIIFAARGELIKVHRLHFFSPCTFTAVYNKRRPEGYVNNTKPQKVIAMYRNGVLQQALDEDEKSTSCDRIFLTRGTGKYVMRLENETEVEALFVAHGFKSVDPSSLSIFEQAKLFYEAKWIVSDEGAALSNGMYCGPNTHIVCIQPESWKDNVFSTIAYLANVHFIHLNAQETGARRAHRVDLEYCRRFIEQHIENEEKVSVTM